MSDSRSNPSVAAGRKLSVRPLPDPPIAGRRQRRAAETRERLFRSALQLFGERGFANVTVQDITEAADVGKGTFFNYFQSKDHVLGMMAEIQVARVNGAMALVAGGRQSIRSVLHRLALKLAEEPGRSPELARAVISAFLASTVVREIVDRRIAEGRKVVAEFIAEGQRRGEINPRLDKEMVAMQFQQAEMGTILMWSLNGGPPLAARIEESFLHFWRAIARPAGKPSREKEL